MQGWSRTVSEDGAQEYLQVAEVKRSAAARGSLLTLSSVQSEDGEGFLATCLPRWLTPLSRRSECKGTAQPSTMQMLLVADVRRVVEALDRLNSQARTVVPLVPRLNFAGCGAC